ncbi:MAG: TRAP transporter small permease [Mycetocola sp.]
MTVLLLAVVAISVTWQVIARYITSSSSAWTSELATNAFVWLAMFAIALGVRRGRHMKLDIWEFLPYRRWVSITVDTLAAIAVVAVLALLVVFGIEVLEPAFRRDLPGLGISYGWVALAVPVGCGLSLIFAIEAWVRTIRSPQDPDALPQRILFDEDHTPTVAAVTTKGL